MMSQHTVRRTIIIGVVILLIAFRFLLIDHANFAPIAAAGIFAIYYLKNKKLAFLLPVVALFFSDIFLQSSTGQGLYGARVIDYAGLFAGIGIAYMLFRRSKSIGSITGATLLGSLAFFVVSNFGVWATSGMYPHTLGGLLTSYEMGIPFYRTTLMGDLFFVGAFFGLFELAQVFIPTLRFAD